MRTFIIICLFAFLNTLLFPQTREEKVKLRQLSQELTKQWELEKHIADSVAIKQNMPIRSRTKDGTTIELQKIENGIPVYYATDNSVSSATISTSKVYSLTSAGFSLSGEGQTLGVWDGGAVLNTHQEFSGRVTQMDGATTTIDHSTHVSGTMIAAGVVPKAKGMSYNANLNAYEWNNDYSEISQASANGLKVSSHSYGTLTGWTYDSRNDGKWVWYGDINIYPSIDYKFGYYGNAAYQWDNILNNSPNLLLCASAGNHRGEGPAPGTIHWVVVNGSWTLSSDSREVDGGTTGYDCMGDGKSLGKNTLTVGAVNGIASGYTKPQDVIMSSFSSWGPTDDGRIKPDVVADGVNLYSSTNLGIDQYEYMSGTSMATPSVSGSVGTLLQQQSLLYGTSNPFRSSTMKALIIHTADEAGQTDGPDYIFGWGLMNTLKAIQILTVNKEAAGLPLIKENTLSQGGTYEYQVQSNGTEPLKATICWTDPAGQIFSASLNNRTPELINDLDLRIIGPGGTEQPWILDPNNPSAAALKGDNIRDNVEQVIIPNPVAGSYTIRVTHKNNLQAGSQVFSIIVTGIVIDIPEVVNLVTPLNNATGVDTRTLLQWERSTKSINFQLQIALDEQFNTIVVDTITGFVYKQFSYNLPELKTLYWRVRGVNGSNGAWSTVFHFTTTASIPEKPVPVYPLSGTLNVKTSPVFIWSTSSVTESFRLQLSTGATFTTLVFNDSTITDTAFKVNNLIEKKKYYWRVKGKNSSGTGEYSATNNFTTGINAPDSLEYTVQGNTTILLSWKDKSLVEDKFFLLRKKDSGVFETIATLNPNTTNYTDTGLAAAVYVYSLYCTSGTLFSDTAEITIDISTGISGELMGIPENYSLSQNFPNPFNPSTMIEYALPQVSDVKFVIYNLLGEIVLSQSSINQAAGYHRFTWQPGSLSSGIYFYSISAKSGDGTKAFNTVKKMLYLK